MAKKAIDSEAAKKKTPRAAREKTLAQLNKQSVTSDERHHLISEAAYYRAERRGFSPGSELEDWLAAEEEIRGALG